MGGATELAENVNATGAVRNAGLVREKRWVLPRQPGQRLRLRCVDRNPPALHEDDSIAALQRQRRSLLGDDDRAPECRGEIEQRLRRLGIELRRRLVEQEQLRTEGERRSDTDPLELAGGELVGLPAHEVTGAQRRERLEDASPDLRGGTPTFSRPNWSSCSTPVITT